ncbi:MAG: hypothetical protein ACLQHF_07890 [Terracidiphilus sp.]
MSQATANPNAEKTGAAADAAASQTGILRRIFGQHLMFGALLVGMTVTLAGALANGSELTQDPDLWWHLADARHLFAAHEFIRVEPYAFTVAGQPWVNPEWLAETPYWIGYKTGGLLGLHLAAVIAFCANLLLIYFRCATKSGHKAAAFWTSVVSFFLIAINAGARTIVIAYLALAIELIILDAAEKGRTRALWLLPALFCIWINLHGSWVIGLGLLGLYIVCGLFPLKMAAFDQSAFSSAELNRLIAVFGASVAALLVNPYGWRLIWNPFDMMLNQKLMVSITQEWQPLSLGTTVGKAAAVFLVLMVVANVRRGRKWKVYELAFLLSGWYFAVSHERFAFLACVLSAPMLAVGLARAFFSTPSEKTIPIFNALIAAGIVVTAVMVSPGPAALEKQLAQTYPLKSIAAIEPGWRTFNEYSIGGMMDFNGKSDFIDSRNDIFEHHGALTDYVAIQNGQDPQNLLKRYGADRALIRVNSPLAATLAATPGWRELMREGAGDNAFVLLAKTH